MIGVFGGTFDPVHYGHLRTALEVKQALRLAEVRMLPSNVPPHRDSPGATAEQRLAMLELALAGQGELTIDRREIERTGPSYMVDTLASLRDEAGDTPLCLILGDDAFAGLASWHCWGELPKLAHLVVMSRPGHEPVSDGSVAALVTERQVATPAALAAAPAGRILFCPVTQLEISATAIRAGIRAGESPRYLLPDAVADYIARAGLYC